jgi:5-methyltetrahydrofolate--homocysteine methyltransferase
MSNYNRIAEILQTRLLVLDGAMGTMIQRCNLQENDYRGQRFAGTSQLLQGNNDLLSLTRPDVIADIHAQYLTAGADIIETNSFSSNRISLADYQLEGLAHELNMAAARLARQVADRFTAENPAKPRFVAGSIGPTNKTASLSPDVANPGARAVTFDDLVLAYREQVEGLLDGGVDLLLVETIFDTLNAKAALFAIEEVFSAGRERRPVIISGTITDASGRTLSGQTVEAFLVAILGQIELLAIGLNCALGARDMRPHLEELAAQAPCYVCAYPNAGLPNQFGEYDQTPLEMAALIQDFLDRGLLNIIGGCCGTTPDHIAAIARIAAQAQPRRLLARSPQTRLSGLEVLTINRESNFINIGERTNVAGSRKFANLIRAGKYEAALAIARQQVEGGAQLLDINMDDAMLEAEKEMVTFLNLLAAEPDIARLPIMIDSSKWPVLEAGLKCLQGKSVVNSISLKDGEAIFLARAAKIRQYGAAVVVMAFDEVGQAVTFERKIEVCARAYRLLTEKAHFPGEDIIFDPNILTVATGIEEHANYAVDFLRAVAWIKANLPHAKISGGLSNLSFALRGNDFIRETMHAVFLYHAIRAGLDMGIVNAGALPVYDQIAPELLELTEDVILNRRPDATERLIAYAETVKGRGGQADAAGDVAKGEEWRSLPLPERLTHALIRGLDEYIAADVSAALAVYPSALSIIEGPLMAGMNQVGDLFGAGKMFLPQVVKSARVMKKAVAVLLPVMEAEKLKNGIPAKAGKILLATVKGDVHDIGKNIVGVVLGCNNYEVIDLGVMVPCEKILTSARQEQVDMIGLSGLITPSLEEMTNIAREMARQGLTIPLLIGGATTSEIHTAVKIAPAYPAPVIHVRDASRCVGVLANLLATDERRSRYIEETSQRYETLRQQRQNVKVPLVSLSAARANRLRLPWAEAPIVAPSTTGVTLMADYPLADIRPYIDWTFFFHIWEMRGRFPALLDDPAQGIEARRLYDDALELLDTIIEKKMLRAKAVFGLFPANSVGDDIEVYGDASQREILTRFCHLRMQRQVSAGEANLGLADFIAPKDSGRLDYIGAFAVTAGLDIDASLARYEAEHDDYRAIMLKGLADRLAEALAELLHLRIRREFWGYAPTENLPLHDLLAGHYQGIRPAPGYPACPDHSEKVKLFRLLDAEKLTGISLTESYAMAPAASVCGFYLAHPAARYFGVGKIGRDQVEDYAQRQGIARELAEKWLAPNIG